MARREMDCLGALVLVKTCLTRKQAYSESSSRRSADRGGEDGRHCVVWYLRVLLAGGFQPRLRLRVWHTVYYWCSKDCVSEESLVLGAKECQRKITTAVRG